MTKALCVLCGAIKFGCYLPCKACGQAPRTRRQVAYSTVLSDHYFTHAELAEMSRGMIEEDRPHPVLPPDQEAFFMDSDVARRFPDEGESSPSA